jgi:hypothetical protein
MGSPPPGLPALVKRRSEHRGPDVKVRTESRSLATRDPNATRSRQTKRGKGTQRPKPAGKDNRRPSAGQQRQQRRNSQRPVRPAPPSISRCPRPAGSGPRAREQTLGARRRMLNISCYKNIILFFGLVREYKGLQYIIYAMENVIKSIDCVLLVVGEFYEPKDKYVSLVLQRDFVTSHPDVLGCAGDGTDTPRDSVSGYTALAPTPPAV